MGGNHKLQDGDETIQRVKEIFSTFDKNGDGSITELELGALLRSIGVKPNAEQVEALFHRGDRDKDGLIDFGEFLQLVRDGSDESRNSSTATSGSDGSLESPVTVEAVDYKEEELRAMFNAFDKDGNGYITAAELAHSMARMGRRLSFRELAEMMAEADLDGDGRISFEEFVTTISFRNN